MARPSKRQLAERKREKQAVKRFDAVWHKLEKLCWEGSFDEFLASCEKCGQEQSGQNPVCVVCGCGFAAWSGDSPPDSEVKSKCDFPLPDEPGALRTIAS